MFALKRLRNRLPFVFLIFALVLPAITQAQQVLLPNQEYTEKSTDLTVKTLAGQVSVLRTWAAGQWYINPAWANLRLIPDPMGGVLAIERAGSIYERTGSLSGDAAASSNGKVYRFDSNNLIEKTVSGWRWYDPLGNAIQYSNSGAILSYNNSNGAKVTFVRDSGGKLVNVQDPQGRTIYTLSYDPSGRISNITDIAGSSVQYRWSSQGLLEQVIDSENQAWRYEYDSHNQIIKRINPAGASVTVSYGSNPGELPLAAGFAGLGSGSSDGSGGGTSGAVASSGSTKAPTPRNARVASFTDESGARWDYRIDYNRTRQEYLVSVQRPDGSNSQSRYSKEGWHLEFALQGQKQWERVIESATQHRLIDARGQTTTIQYDADLRPLRVVYADGSSVSTKYDAQGRIVQQIDQQRAISTWRYSPQGNLVEAVEAAGLPEQISHKYTHDQWGNTLTYTRGAGAAQGADAISESYTYDSWGNLSSITDGLGNSTQVSYSFKGLVTTFTNPLGATWTSQYDKLGRYLRSSDPLGREKQRQYNSAGQVASYVDALNNRWNYSYDAIGNILSVENPLGYISKRVYDPMGRQLSRTTPGGQKVQAQYDSLGRRIGSVDAAGNAIQLVYGADGSALAGRVVSIKYPTFQQAYRYDQSGRITQTIQTPDGNVGNPQALTWRFGWNALGQRISMTDPAGNATLTRYDVLGRTVETIDSLNQSTKQTWDAHGNVTSVTDAKGNTHRFDYDKAGRLLQEIRPGGGITRFQYDAAGQLTQRTDAGGNIRRYQYDKAGNLTVEEHLQAGSALDQRITYQYNANNQLIAYDQQDGQGQAISAATYQIDALGRITQRATKLGNNPTAITVGQSYNPDGQLASHTYPDGSQTQYSYLQGQLAQVKLPNGSAVTYGDYQWLQPTKIQTPGATKTQTFDALQRPLGITVQGAANQTLMSRSYQYDSAGNITQITSDLGLTQYSHDALGRLTQAKPDTTLQTLGLPTEQYTYDSVHNRTSSAHQPGAWSYNAENQLTQYPALQNGQTLATQVQYNAQGHTQKEINSRSTKTYQYNVAERLVRYEEIGSSAPVQASYRYDPYGRRISKTTTQSGNSQTTYYAYGSSGLLAELNDQGVVTKAYGWNPQAADLWSTAPLWQAETNPQNANLSNSATAYHYLHTDHLETPVLGTDKSGTQTWKAISEAFGETKVDTASTITMNLRFAGQYFDDESGLHQNYFRDYHSRSGRYIQRDPIGLSGGMNVHGYAGLNPITNADPFGLSALRGAAWGARVGAAAGTPLGPVGVGVLGAIGAGAGALIGWYVTGPALQESAVPTPPVPGAVPHSENPTTGSGTRQWEKPGGFDAANNDYDQMGVENSQDKGNGIRTGNLPNGDRVIVRPDSRSGEPTIEIQRPDGKRSKDKIRYCE